MIAIHVRDLLTKPVLSNSERVHNLKNKKKMAYQNLKDIQCQNRPNKIRLTP